MSLNNLEKFPLPFDHPIRVYVNRVGDVDRVIQNSKFISGPRSILKWEFFLKLPPQGSLLNLASNVKGVWAT